MGERDYFEIGKSVCCESWSAGSHKTGNKYLRKKLGLLQKLWDQVDFLKFKFSENINIFYFVQLHTLLQGILFALFYFKNDV